MDYLPEKPLREHRELKKKGLLLKREYRGSHSLDLKLYASDDYHLLGTEDIQNLDKEMKGYLNKLKHLSIKYDCWGQILSFVPLLRGIKQNFVGLVSLKLSIRKAYRLELEDLYAFERLFLCLKPTLRHLDLDFAENLKYEAKFSETLGWIIMQTLTKLETLRLEFRDPLLSISLVRFFINTACPKMKKLRSLRLRMENCFLSKEEDISEASTSNNPNNLQCLQLDLDGCHGLNMNYLWRLQSDIIVKCPVLEELFIRLPDYYKIFFKFSESTIKEEFLKSLSLKRLAVEWSHVLDDNLSYYQIAQELKREEEMKIVESACHIRQKAGGEEDFRLYCEALNEEEDLSDEGLDVIDELECEKWEEMKEQDEVERILHGEATEQEWQIVRENDEYWDE